MSELGDQIVHAGYGRDVQARIAGELAFTPLTSGDTFCDPNAVITHDFNVDMTTCDQQTLHQLLAAAADLSEEAADSVCQIIENGGAMSLVDHTGMTPLHHAAAHGNRRVAEVLLECADQDDLCCDLGFAGAICELVTAADKLGATPLHYAARSSTEVLSAILHRAGGQQLLLTTQGISLPLEGDLNPSQLLRMMDRQGRTPLHWAAEAGNTTAIHVILSHLPPALAIDAADACGCSPLHLAATEGRHQATELLLADGADQMMANNLGNLAVHCAAEQGHDAVLQLLADHHSRQMQKNSNRSSWPGAMGGVLDNSRDRLGTPGFRGSLNGLPLRGASDNSVEKTPVSLLDTVNHKDQTPLFLAISNQHAATADLLLQLGANPNCADSLGATPLHVVSDSGQAQMVDLLLNYHARTDMHDNVGWAPLHLAAYNAHHEVVTSLLLAGADVNLANICPGPCEGWTPLHCASMKAAIDMVRCLLDHGADMKAMDAHGLSACHLAAMQGHTEVVEVFVTLLQPSRPNSSRASTDIIQARRSTSSELADDIHLMRMSSEELQAAAAAAAAEAAAATAAANAPQSPFAMIQDGPIAGSPTEAPKTSTVLEPFISQQFSSVPCSFSPFNTPLGYSPLNLAILHHRHSSVQLLLSRLPTSLETSVGTAATSVGTAATSRLAAVSAASRYNSNSSARTSSSGSSATCATYISESNDPAHNPMLHQARWVVPRRLAGIVEIDDGVYTTVSGSSDVEAWVRYDDGMDAGGWMYFEVEAQSLGDTGLFWVGLGPRRLPDNADKATGLLPFSHVLCSLDGNRSSLGHSNPYGPRVGEGDVVGVFWNRACRSVTFTLNRKYGGIAFTDLAPGIAGLCPVVGTKSGGLRLRLSTGGSLFLKNLDSLLFKEEQLHRSQAAGLEQALSLGARQVSRPWRFKTRMHALHFAACCNNADALVLLLGRGADVDLRDADGWTPLHFASVHGHLEVADILIRHGAQVNATTHFLSTPLIFAVRHCHSALVRRLLEPDARADVHVLDHNQRTLLMRAARSGQTDILQMLLDKNVDLNARDKFGKTALQFAKNDAVFQLLYEKRQAKQWRPDLMMATMDDLHAMQVDCNPEWEIPHCEIQQLEKVGSGGFGIVYKARYNGDVVAMKVLHEQGLTRKAMEDFKRELDFMSRLRCPKVVQFLGAVTRSDNALGMAIVTEYCARRSLHHVLASAKPAELSPERRLRMAMDTAQGMLYLHSRKPMIIHRDLKPSNLLVKRDYTVKVGDFGLSTLKTANMLYASQANPVGTVMWMAPELLHNKAYDEKVDVYSFGVVLFELATGSTPYGNVGVYDTRALMVQRYIGVLKLQDHMPAGLDERVQQLITDCLEEDPTKRPAFGEILERLRQLPGLTLPPVIERNESLMQSGH